MASFAYALQTGDAVIARVYDSSSGRLEHIAVEGVVVLPASARENGPNAKVVVALQLPGGEEEEREVPVANLVLPPTVRAEFVRAARARA